MSVPIRIVPSERPAEAPGTNAVRDLAAQLIIRLRRDNLALDDLRDALETNEALDRGRTEGAFRSAVLAAPSAATDPVLPGA